MFKKALIIVIACLIVISISAGSLTSGNSVKNSTLASNSDGNVTKIDYSSKNGAKTKIAVVSGMHPRETVSKDISEKTVKDYARSNKVNIVNYIVEVNENFDYVFSGRNKGEDLVSKYVVPDVVKSGYKVVIICHDHKEGYGDGFYVATPTMDSKSLAIAEEFRKISPEYKYCQRNPDKQPKSESITKVDNPIVDYGIPVFVYEIPEWSSLDEAYAQTYKLIDTAYKIP